MGKLFRRLRKAAGWEHKELTAYSYRHWYAWRWLKAGKGPMILARQMGTSLGLIMKCYGHLLEYHEMGVEEVRKVAQ